MRKYLGCIPEVIRYKGIMEKVLYDFKIDDPDTMLFVVLF